MITANNTGTPYVDNHAKAWSVGVIGCLPAAIPGAMEPAVIPQERQAVNPLEWPAWRAQ